MIVVPLSVPDFINRYRDINVLNGLESMGLEKKASKILTDKQLSQ